MYLSADRLALANQTVRETFEQCSVAWQAIPHWDTGDPGQSVVRSDTLPPSGPLPIISLPAPLEVTVAEAMAPTPDALLAKVMAVTRALALVVDIGVLLTIRSKITVIKPYDISSNDKTLESLINARAAAELGGYRAPSCIFVTTSSLVELSKLIGGYAGTEVLLGPAMINSLHRVEALEPLPLPAKPTRAILLGRQDRIAHGDAANASPGEEPVDLAISVMPGLVVVGETTTGNILLNVRISGAVRVKDPKGVVALNIP